jgi:hypothetical protein
MAVLSEKVGSVYLFYHPGHNAKHLLISAHGEHVTALSKGFKKGFKLPKGKQLHFYTLDHAAMRDMSLAAVAEGSQAEYDIGKFVGPKFCSNYKLYYYENDKYQDFMNACNAKATDYPDVAYIAVVGATSLADVLQDLATRKYARYQNYAHIHCVFCRCGYLHTTTKKDEDTPVMSAFCMLPFKKK